jgi:hypothetical protein
MGKNPLKRSLIIGIVFLFLSTTCIPVLASEGKPDLIVSGIYYGTIGDVQDVHVVGGMIKNIGDANAIGNIDVSYTIRRLPSLISVRSGTIHGYGGIVPGTEIDFTIGDTHGLPKFGFFRVTCEVNPGRTINESNYDNNKGSQNFLVLFGVWFPLNKY